MIATAEYHVDELLTGAEQAEREHARSQTAARRALAKRIRCARRHGHWIGIVSVVHKADDMRHISPFESARLISWAIAQAKLDNRMVLE